MKWTEFHNSFCAFSIPAAIFSVCQIGGVEVQLKKEMRSQMSDLAGTALEKRICLIVVYHLPNWASELLHLQALCATSLLGNWAVLVDDPLGGCMTTPKELINLYNHWDSDTWDYIGKSGEWVTQWHTP